MDKTIVLDCQAKVANLSCEDCIAFKECTLSKKNNRKPQDAWVADMEIFAVV
jgi:hypothetical protein